MHLFGSLSAAKLTEGAYFDLIDDNSKTVDFVMDSKTTEGSEPFEQLHTRTELVQNRSATMLLVVERVKPSSGSCHLRSDSYSVILPPSKLQECMDPFTHCAAVKQQAVFTWAIFVLAAMMLATRS